MTDLATSVRAKRGIHRLGLALAILSAAPVLLFGLIDTVQSTTDEQRRFLALRCADERIPSGLIPGDPVAAPKATSSDPPQFDPSKPYAEFDRLNTKGALILLPGPEMSHRDEIPIYYNTNSRQWCIELKEAGCDYWLSATIEDIRGSRTGFSYVGNLIKGFSSSALVAGMCAFVIYFLFATLSWVVRGFMRN
jgi:hypothetical protein